MIKKKNILGLLFLLSTLCFFNSCEDDPYYDDYGWATDALCSNTWVDFYTNNKGYECEQRLDFYNDHTGEDFTIIYYPNGRTDELKTSFYWTTTSILSMSNMQTGQTITRTSE